MSVLAGLPAAPSPETVSPGIAGFAAMFVLALATVLLVRSMVGHLRKVRYGPGPDHDASEAADASAAAAPPQAGGAPRPDGTEGVDGPPPAHGTGQAPRQDPPAG